MFHMDTNKKILFKKAEKIESNKNFIENWLRNINYIIFWNFKIHVARSSDFSFVTTSVSIDSKCIFITWKWVLEKVILPLILFLLRWGNFTFSSSDTPGGKKMKNIHFEVFYTNKITSVSRFLIVENKCNAASMWNSMHNNL